jgi:uncharacterized protein (DUF1015 family)
MLNATRQVGTVPDEDLRAHHAELNAKGNQILIEYLTADLDLGFSFARLSKLERALNEAASKQAQIYAQQVIKTVKNFRHRVKDDEIVKEIEKRLAELDSVILELSS